jgi:hypothetical protein
MAGYPDETTQSSHPSSPDHGNGPGQSSSYFSGIGDAWDSLTAAAETDWEWTKSQTAELWTGTKEEAAYLYAEADKWGRALLGAKTWDELHHIANKLLGPESFFLGACCGIVVNLGEMAFGLLDLLKTFILAGLYEKLHGPLGVDAFEPSSVMLRFARPVFDKILGKQMNDAVRKVRALISGIGKIIKEPGKFLGALWTSSKDEYVTKWHRYEQLVSTGRAVDQFRAGELAGEVLAQVVLTVLALISGVGAAIRGVQVAVGGVRLTAAAVAELSANLTREAPEVLEIAEGMKTAEGAGSTAEAAANAGQEADAAADATPSKPKSLREQYVGRTPGKNSRTGQAVQARMRAEGTLRDGPEGTEFKASDGEWYPLEDADMSHKTDAVKWWNETGRQYGPKSPEVRTWMLDPDNYTLDHYSINRSSGAKLPDGYLPPLE